MKLSNGFASGGDIKLDTDGRRFILKSTLDSAFGKEDAVIASRGRWRDKLEESCMNN